VKNVRDMGRQEYARVRSPQGIRAHLRAQEQTEPAVERPGDNIFTDRSGSLRQGYDDALNLANRLAERGGVRNLDRCEYAAAKKAIMSPLRRSNGYRPAPAPADSDDPAAA
jgi:hypothetical protein